MRTFVFSLLTLISFVAAGEACKPRVDSCEFYQCMERKWKCGREGYLQKFAYPSCKKFLRKQGKFTPYGQEWLDEIRVELMKQVTKIPRHWSCREFEQEAFQQHVVSYIKTGYCFLPPEDHSRVFWYTYKSVLNPLYLKTGWQIHKFCQRLNPPDVDPVL